MAAQAPALTIDTNKTTEAGSWGRELGRRDALVAHRGWEMVENLRHQRLESTNREGTCTITWETSSVAACQDGCLTAEPKMPAAGIGGLV